MGLFTDTVPKDLYDRLDERYADLQVAYQKLVDQMMDMKRHDIGMYPKNFDPSTLDPMNALGPKTQAAIDEYAAGDPSIRNYLIRQAHVDLASTMARVGGDTDAADDEVADLIRQGDRA